MDLYNGIIRSTEELLAGSSGRTWLYDAAAAWPDAGRNELIMQREAAFELGGGSLPAVTYACVSSEGGPEKSEVLLYGPDLGALKADSPYARLVLLTVGDIGEADAAYDAIREIEFVRYHVFPRGFMMRALPDDCREQVRVGKDAVRRGISFRQVGFAFIRKFLENPAVKSVRVIFVTDSAAPYRELLANGKKAADITKSLSTILKGLPTDCASCSLKPICDEVEGMKELHFSQRKT